MFSVLYRLQFREKRTNNYSVTSKTLCLKKKSVEKTSMVRFRKGIFKNNSGTVTLDGNYDLWAENLKGVLKLKHMLGEYRKLFRSL